MIRGMYNSASGMIPRLRQQEVVANNMANATTVGFKKDNLFIRELSRAEQKTSARRADWEKPLAEAVFVDQTPGTFDRTGNPLDIAIEGDGFFRLQTTDGRTLLTRAGAFEVNGAGQIAHSSGALLIGESGPISVGGGAVTIAQTGEVEVDGAVVGRIVPHTVASLDQLTKAGKTTYALPDGIETSPATSTLLHQGYVESSNVEVVNEMINMMASYRAFESNGRALQLQDQSLDALFQRVLGDR